MNKNKQIIVRMTEDEKSKLDEIAKRDGGNVSSLVRNLVFEFIRQKSKGGK